MPEIWNKIKRAFTEEARMESEQPQSPWTAEPDPDQTQPIPSSHWGGTGLGAPVPPPVTGERLTPYGKTVADADELAAAGFIAAARTTEGEQRSFGEAEERIIMSREVTDLPAPDPVTDSGQHFMGVPGLTPHGADDNEGEQCPHCGSRIPNDHELLVELLGWLAPAGEAFVHQFYIDLFAAVPDLRELFPAQIEIQEEKLLSAIVALLKLFKGSDEDMESLNSALARFGRSHTRFDPAATIEEYAAVWSVLSDLAVRMLGDKITPRHAAALRRAYEYAAGMMLAAQATARLKGAGRRRRTVDAPAAS